jgi:hypothetical protein
MATSVVGCLDTSTRYIWKDVDGQARSLGRCTEEGGHTLDEFLEEFPSSVGVTAAIAALEHAKDLVIAQAR